MRDAYTDETVVNTLKAIEGGESPVTVARAFNIPIGTITSWMRKGRGPKLFGKLVSTPENARKRRRKTRRKPNKTVTKMAAQTTIKPTKEPRDAREEVEFLRGLVLRLAAALTP